MSSYASLILGSAAIGALVSSLFTLLSSTFERRSRRRELLLSKAIDLAELQVKLLQDAATAGGSTARIYPYIVYVRWYHKQLTQLHFNGKVSHSLEEKYREFIDSAEG
jgi:hypothetical protein